MVEHALEADLAVVARGVGGGAPVRPRRRPARRGVPLALEAPAWAAAAVRWRGEDEAAVRVQLRVGNGRWEVAAAPVHAEAADVGALVLIAAPVLKGVRCELLGAEVAAVPARELAENEAVPRVPELALDRRR